MFVYDLGARNIQSVAISKFREYVEIKHSNGDEGFATDYKVERCCWLFSMKILLLFFNSL